MQEDLIVNGGLFILAKLQTTLIGITAPSWDVDPLKRVSCSRVAYLGVELPPSHLEVWNVCHYCFS